jgi:predicted RNase H-like nuclease (RuvC/YqgF family)
MLPICYQLDPSTGREIPVYQILEHPRRPSYPMGSNHRQLDRVKDQLSDSEAHVEQLESRNKKLKDDIRYWKAESRRLGSNLSQAEDRLDKAEKKARDAEKRSLTQLDEYYQYKRWAEKRIDELERRSQTPGRRSRR